MLENAFSEHISIKHKINNHCHLFKCVFLYCMTSKIGLIWMSAKIYRIPTVSLSCTSCEIVAQKISGHLLMHYCKRNCWSVIHRRENPFSVRAASDKHKCEEKVNVKPFFPSDEEGITNKSIFMLSTFRLDFYTVHNEQWPWVNVLSSMYKHQGIMTNMINRKIMGRCRHSTGR